MEFNTSGKKFLIILMRHDQNTLIADDLLKTHYLHNVGLKGYFFLVEMLHNVIVHPQNTILRLMFLIFFYILKYESFSGPFLYGTPSYTLVSLDELVFFTAYRFSIA